MRAEDKQKPVSLTIKIHPKTLEAAKELALWLNDSSLDHIVSEAILDAAKDKDFQRWKESRPPVSEPAKLAEVTPEKHASKPGKAVA